VACICRQNSLRQVNVRAKSQPFAEQQHATGRTAPGVRCTHCVVADHNLGNTNHTYFHFYFHHSFLPREVDFGRDYIGTNFINMHLSFNVNGL